MSTPTSIPTSRRAQMMQTYTSAKRSDPKIGLYILLAFLVGAAVGFAAVWFLSGKGWLSTVAAVVSAILLGVLLGLIVFGRRAMAAQYRQMDGQKGAAAGALQMLRRGWTTTPMVGFNKQQDLVHRVIGPPGVVLVGEGDHARVQHLLSTERRKHERVLADTPVHVVVCGNGEGEVPLAKLVKHVTKLGRSVKPAEITDILNRIKAIDAQRGTLPMPKGPVPTSMKGVRNQQRGR